MQQKIYLATLAAVVGFSGPLSAQVSFTQNDSLIGPAAFNMAPGCVVDMNNDYLDDVVRILNGQLTIDYQQAPGQAFSTQTYMAPDANGLWSICAADVNDNGYTDLLLGDGSFVEFLTYDPVTQNFVSDHQPDYIFSQRSTYADIDNDGWVDAFVCHDVDGNHPYRNDGSGNMILDTSLIQTVDLPGNYSALWVDYDNDNDIDLYITKCRGGAVAGDPSRTNALYQNDGMGNFTEVATTANMADNDQSWSTVFQDFDNDGDFDAFTVNHEQANRFMINNGDGTFTNIISTTGISEFDLGAWENIAADFDNNGYVDILSELNDELYLNNGDLTFTAVQLDFDEGGIGDLNGDGFLDVYDGAHVYLNDGNNNNWLKVELEGTASNRSAIGARIQLYGNFGIQMREVRSGTSFSTMSSLNTYFGLGTEDTVDSLMVRWPSGIVQWRTDIAANQVLNIVEGVDPEPASVREWKSFDGMQLYPNPAADQATVVVDEKVAANGNVRINLYDISGKLLQSPQLGLGNTAQFDLRDVAPGSYLVQVTAGGTPVYTNRLVVQ